MNCLFIYLGLGYKRHLQRRSARRQRLSKQFPTTARHCPADSAPPPGRHRGHGGRPAGGLPLRQGDVVAPGRGRPAADAAGRVPRRPAAGSAGGLGDAGPRLAARFPSCEQRDLALRGLDDFSSHRRALLCISAGHCKEEEASFRHRGEHIGCGLGLDFACDGSRASHRCVTRCLMHAGACLIV